MSAVGRYCCKSPKNGGGGGAQNRGETRRGEKVPFNSIVTRLRKPLVAWPAVWVVPHMFFEGHSYGPGKVGPTEPADFCNNIDPKRASAAKVFCVARFLFDHLVGES